MYVFSIIADDIRTKQDDALSRIKLRIRLNNELFWRICRRGFISLKNTLEIPKLIVLKLKQQYEKEYSSEIL